MSNNKVTTTDAPEIIWHSDPVRPNETIVLNGYAFSASSKVELCRLQDDEGEKCDAILEPLVATSDSIKVVVPETWTQGIYACKVTSGKKSSRTVLVNAPDIWWQQGEGGVDTAVQGGWLRLQGKCLAFDLKPQVKLIAAKKEIVLEVKEYSQYSVEVIVPEDIEAGEYTLAYSNGYGGEQGIVNVDAICILPKKKNNQKVFNVLDFGADPTGKKDSTLPIVAAIEHLGGFGGGVIYFPAGRYRIDSILRSGVYIKTPLKVPQNVTLRGESMELVSLWWPDQEEPLPSLIECGSDCEIEELTIYTQGKHSTIITGESNVTINRVRIRANCYYMTNNNGGRHHEREVDVDFNDTSLGSAFAIWGDNLKITNCDIYTSNICFDVKHCSGGYIANNTVMAKDFFFLSGCTECIFENNQFIGNQLTTGGSNFALHFGARVSKHNYLAHNTISHIYGGDHEAFTLDGHGNSYFGKVKNIESNKLTLSDNWYKDVKQKGYMGDSQGVVLSIVEGKGRGQYRWIENYDGLNITLDSPWLVEPDEKSLVSVSAFNGRHLIIGNTMSDTGTAVQLYAPNYECIVAENKTYRASNINTLSRLRKDKVNGSISIELSWYNQFLDNEIVEGNCWGGGCTEVDRWIGGEGCLNIWGLQLNYYTDEFGAGQGGFANSEVVKGVLKEADVRKISIPMSLFTIVRRHKIHNNSSIRVRSRVSEVLIENCQIANSARGIRIDSEIEFEMPSDLGQLFDFDSEDVEVLKFLSPDQVLIRNNNFDNVASEYCGNAIDQAIIKNK
jgi:hypothetical protein